MLINTHITPPNHFVQQRQGAILARLVLFSLVDCFSSRMIDYDVYVAGSYYMICRLEIRID